MVLCSFSLLSGRRNGYTAVMVEFQRMPQQSRWILAVFTPQTSVSNPQMAKTLSFVFEHILQSWSFPESLKLLQQSWDRAVDGDCELCLNCRWPCKDPLIIYLFSGHRKGRMICGHWCDGPRAVEQEYLDPRSIKMCVCVQVHVCFFRILSIFLWTLWESPGNLQRRRATEPLRYMQVLSKQRPSWQRPQFTVPVRDHTWPFLGFQHVLEH